MFAQLLIFLGIFYYKTFSINRKLKNRASHTTGSLGQRRGFRRLTETDGFDRLVGVVKQLTPRYNMAIPISTYSEKGLFDGNKT